LVDHLGRDPDELPVLSEPLESAEHPNVQLALDELAAPAGWRVVGLSLGLRQYCAFSLGALATDRMVDWGFPSPRPMPVEYLNVPIGPDDPSPAPSTPSTTPAMATIPSFASTTRSRNTSRSRHNRRDRAVTGSIV